MESGSLSSAFDHAHQYHAREENAPIDLGRYAGAIHFPYVADYFELLLYLRDLLTIELDLDLLWDEPSERDILSRQTSAGALNHPPDLLSVRVKDVVLIFQQR